MAHRTVRAGTREVVVRIGKRWRRLGAWSLEPAHSLPCVGPILAARPFLRGLSLTVGWTEGKLRKGRETAIQATIQSSVGNFVVYRFTVYSVQ